LTNEMKLSSLKTKNGKKESIHSPSMSYIYSLFALVHLVYI
jgi:hypothetical protein